MPNVGLSERALDDVDEIVDWLASFNLQAALNFIDAYEAALGRLARLPHIGHKHAALRQGLFVITAGDYVVVYEERRSDVRVLRVAHGRSDLRRLRV